MIMENRLLLLFAICICIILSVSPVCAVNESVNTYTVHDEPYTPLPVFAITFAVGFGLLILSFLFPPDDAAGAFSGLAIPILFAAAWMANQLDIASSGIIGDATDSISRTDHNIYPAVVLAAVIFMLAVVAILRLYTVITTARNESKPKYRNPNYREEDDY
jgi:glucan phosphoethanolaminetransferase (alkaline phosphatase superfamily)